MIDLLKLASHDLCGCVSARLGILLELMLSTQAHGGRLHTLHRVGELRPRPLRCVDERYLGHLSRSAYRRR